MNECKSCGTLTKNSTYCSRRCSGISNLPKRKAKTRDCLYCGSITRNKKFCSKSCAASFNNKGINRHNTLPKPCANCGNVLKDNRLTFCNASCHKEYQYKEYIKRWLRGEESGGTDNGVSLYVRRWLHELHNDKCSECGWGVKNEYTSKVPLQIHHIDGDYRNNAASNLSLICANCHTLTPSYGARNKGNGRVHRS